MSGFAPKKQFSQNFLTDVSIARNIVAQLHPCADDCIIEVGPGKGALTRLLLDAGPRHVLAVDVDPRAIEYLHQQQWTTAPNFSCQQQDALRVQVEEQFPNCQRDHRKVIGNIPYAITSELLFWSFAQHQSVSRVVFMMQKEVAKRCVAMPGTKDYGILSVATWLFGEAKIAFSVQPGSFFPRPEVTSAVVVFTLRPTLPLDIEAAPFMAFVRGAFSQRRKVMTNSLADWARREGVDLRAEHVIEHLDLAKTRAEELTPSKLAELFLVLTRRKELAV